MFRPMRRFKQQVSEEECIRVLKNGRRGVLSMIGDEGYPYGIPINYFYDEQNHVIYFHGAGEGHKIDSLKRCSKACFTVWDDGYKEEGDWAYYFTSVIVMGKAQLLPDNEEALNAIRSIGLKYYPAPEDVENIMKKTAGRVHAIKLNIDHMTGKRVHEK
jgi:nitroimidazol reductase NimA-like FMN-containing flavoprotein (pyridoxamine 5'-phosphate oxidase superfamily)